jgi:Transposase DDE domain
VTRGWAADRTIGRQVKTMQVCTRAGVALYYRPHPGGSNEAPWFTDTLERIRELAPPGVVCVIDSGFGHLSKLCAADAKGLRFVVPLRADTGWAGWFAADVADGLTALARLDHCSARERRLLEHERTVWKGVLRHREIDDPDTGMTHRLRIAYLWSSEEAASVADARHRALATAEDALTRIRNGLGGRYYTTKKQVDDRVATIIGYRIAELITVTTGLTDDGKPTIAWHRNPDAITAASALDGLYALATNLPDPPDRQLTALDVLDIYKDQWIVEQRHRDLKQTLHVRPVFLHNDDRIHALIAVIGIALLIYGLIEADLRAALGPDTPLPGLLPEHRDAVPTARAVLTAFTDLHATYTSGGFVLDRFTTVQRLILAHLDIPLQWPETHSTTTTSKTTHLNPQPCGNGARDGAAPQAPPSAAGGALSLDPPIGCRCDVDFDCAR